MPRLSRGSTEAAPRLCRDRRKIMPSTRRAGDLGRVSCDLERVACCSRVCNAKLYDVHSFFYDACLSRAFHLAAICEGLIIGRTWPDLQGSRKSKVAKPERFLSHNLKVTTYNLLSSCKSTAKSCQPKSCNPRKPFKSQSEQYSLTT